MLLWLLVLFGTGCAAGTHAGADSGEYQAAAVELALPQGPEILAWLQAQLGDGWLAQAMDTGGGLGTRVSAGVLGEGLAVVDAMDGGRGLTATLFHLYGPVMAALRREGSAGFERAYGIELANRGMPKLRSGFQSLAGHIATNGSVALVAKDKPEIVIAALTAMADRVRLEIGGLDGVALRASEVQFLSMTEAVLRRAAAGSRLREDFEREIVLGMIQATGLVGPEAPPQRSSNAMLLSARLGPVN